MRPNVLLLLLPVIALGPAAVVATPNPNAAPPFQITDLLILSTSRGNTTLHFTVHDPNPLTNATQSCSTSWHTRSADYPTGAYLPCGSNASFAFNFAAYKSVSDFTINLEHVFLDPALGPYPYDYISNYGSAVVNDSALWCAALGGMSSCEQRFEKTIEAPITETSG